MKKVLITGGAGFIGSNLCLKLIANGYSVSVLDNLHSQIHGTNPEVTSPIYQSIANKVKFIKGDVTKRADLLMALDRIDIIVHLAAETGTGQSMYEIERYSNVNIGGTALLLDILANTKHNVKKIVIASSRAIYGEGRYYSEDLKKYVYPPGRTEIDMKGGDFEVKYPNCFKKLSLCSTNEDSKIHPSSFYGITKQVQEQMIMTMSPSLNIEPVALRYQNVYGPGQSLKNPYTGILSIFSTQIFQGKDINIYEDGNESRDFVYIDDVVNATVLAIEKPEAAGNSYNVGTGVPISVLEVAKKLRELYCKDEIDLKITGDFRVGDIRHNYADISKITKDLGFKPLVDFHEGITKFAEWVKSNKQDEKS